MYMHIHMQHYEVYLCNGVAGPCSFHLKILAMAAGKGPIPLLGAWVAIAGVVIGFVVTGHFRKLGFLSRYFNPPMNLMSH